MDWIYLSPHFDDAALSCGGLIWELGRLGEQVQVWTICAGEPPPGKLSPFAASLHQRWQTETDAVEQRRLEDINSCKVMGAAYRHFSIPDCIYRPGQNQSNNETCPVCDTEESLFTGFNSQDERLADELARVISDERKAVIVSPLGLGNHVDHWLVRTAAERSGSSLLYYPDYPYVLADSKSPGTDGWLTQDYPVSEDGLSAWVEAIAAYRSQISSFWPDLDHMRLAIREYWERYRGVRLWKGVANREKL